MKGGSVKRVSVSGNDGPAAKDVPEYAGLLGEIRERIRAAQYAALRAVNRELIELYWDIGRLIVERQRGDSWGRAVVESLAQDLRAEFPGVGGFSASNLWRIKLFYQTYITEVKLAPMVREIGWSHNIIIMEKSSGSAEREFYLTRTREFGWTKNVLALQIQNQTWQKTLGNQTNFDMTLQEPVRAGAKLAVKDEYTFDFLELGEEHGERELERALWGRVEKFLREMGGRFAFVGSQFRLEVEGDEFFIDLVLYHRGLRCLVPRLISFCNSNLARAAPVAPEGATDSKGKCLNNGDFSTGMHESAENSLCHFSHFG